MNLFIAHLSFGLVILFIIGSEFLLCYIIIIVLVI
uniref:Uncharacterized protein n=1 Tax=Laurencia verruciformis TaxID=3073068 RepID=A0AA51NF88_9FLOR|nr:hypothetical protein RU989_pgp074 [Laurencia obtusa]WMP12293.1 hypothetical protein [Laurencia verruciformis]WMP12937.1 hypothetical protein [Laurencia obtusa]